MHYYSLNIADYRKDTQHLKPIEHYIYRELIDWYYLDEKPIPNKTQLVIRRLRLTEDDEKSLLNILEEFFICKNNLWSHLRIEKELSNYHHKAKIAKINGSKGGRPKKTQPVNLANPEITQGKANHKPLTNNHKPVIKEKDKKKTKVFTRPSVDEVSQYIFEKKYTIEPQRFIDHYDSNGWKVGRNSMKDWKAAVRTWQGRENKDNEKNQRNSQPKRSNTTNLLVSYKERLQAAST